MSIYTIIVYNMLSMAQYEIVVSSGMPDGVEFDRFVDDSPTAVEDGYQRVKELIDSRAGNLLGASITRDFDDNLTGHITLQIGPPLRRTKEYLLEKQKPAIPVELRPLRHRTGSAILSFGSTIINREPVNYFTVAADSPLLYADTNQGTEAALQSVKRHGDWLVVSAALSSKLTDGKNKKAPDMAAMEEFLLAELATSPETSAETTAPLPSDPDLDKLIDLYGNDPVTGIRLSKRFMRASVAALASGLATTAAAVALDKQGKHNRLVNAGVVAAGLQLGAAVVGRLVGEVIREDTRRIQAALGDPAPTIVHKETAH